LTAIIENRIDHPKAQTVFGFWIYIMTDAMIFASLFLVFVVQRHALAGGPGGKQLFNLKDTFLETCVLLTSSLTCGFAMLGLHHKKPHQIIFWLAVTALLGAGFVAMEISEFAGMIAKHAGPDRSAFLSAFFTLVGTHGLHVTAGILWSLVLLVQLIFMRDKLETKLVHRLLAFSLFWHFLDIVWIGLFSFIYLVGMS
jgi:cytochrome o ubiquinol oxidase subunit 3